MLTTPIRHANGFDQFVLPLPPLGTSPALLDMIERYRIGFFSDREEEQPNWNASAHEIYAFEPLSTADLAAKLIIAIHYRNPEHCGRELAIEAPGPAADRLAIEMELACLDTLLGQIRPFVVTVTPAEDPSLVAAFETYRDNFAKLKALPADGDDAALYDQMDPSDAMMQATPARTVAGALMKLKRVFVSVVGEQWSDHAVFDNKPPQFAQGVRTSDLYTEMFWRAIEDLERFAEGR